MSSSSILTKFRPLSNIFVFSLKYIQSTFYHLVMLPPKQEKVANVFRSIDKDGNGKIDRDEYTAALIKMHIPKAITDIVTESVFGKFDTNKDEGIDEKEFVRYFSDEQNAAVHKRIYRSNFEDQYTLVWGLYFCLVGLKLILDSKGLLSDCFPGMLDKDDTVVEPALHMTAILGWSWFTGGANVLMQRLLGVSQVFAYGSIAVFWSLLTIYENFVGSIIGAEGFQEPPVLVTILSIGLGLYGIWSILTERAKVKED